MDVLSPMHWGVVAAAGVALLVIWKGGDFVTWATTPSTTPTKRAAGATPTAQEAFAAVETLAIYKAKCKDDPAYVGIQAATKAQLEAP